MIRSCLLFSLVFSIVLAVAGPGAVSAQDTAVRVWEEPLAVPTYLTGPPDPNPMFYFGRAYQGARGRIYPYPLYDKLTDKREDKTYKALYLENEYVKICVLPELGGRIFSAVDKTNGYDFFYRQHVVKPALIGMLGAWISGGVEWNVPHHHRATSFLPVQYRTEENADGSKTIWIGEMELRHRMRWAIGLTLRPGKSYLETSVRILNRTPYPHSILYFANVAVHTNENYQIIFPPRTQFVAQHAKREFARWPVADSVYAGTDFTGGVDVSMWKNHPNPISMFAWNYEDDFLAGYDHGKQAGTLSVADHHVVPGKKFWTWGNGPAGKMWDRILSDEDGPYVELMVGAYSDNQPDYSWMQPYEVKSFQQFWYPFREIGGVKNANLEAAVNLEMVRQNVARMGFNTTSAHPEATVRLSAAGRVLLEEKVAINPDKPYAREITIPAGVKEHDLRASLSAGGRELVSYTPVRLKHEPLPRPVQPPPPPEQVKTNEELYLAGLRLEQFHSPALEPEPYYEEALRRDPGDARVNTALGIRFLMRGKYQEAEEHFRTALDRLTMNYTSPKNGEPYYYLGVALKAQAKLDEAYDAFYKATWSAAWQAAAYYSLAEIACHRGEWPAALDFLDRALSANSLNTRALNLKAAVLRKLKRPGESSKAATAATGVDPLNVRAMAERWLAAKRPEADREFRTVLVDHPATGLETAAEFANAGLWDDGAAVLSEMIAAAPDHSRVSPMVYYYLGYFAARRGTPEKASSYDLLAAQMPPDYVFPFQLEAIDALRQAMKSNPKDARAPYYLGNLLYDLQPENAIKEWERSRALDGSFPIVHRNLGLAYARRTNGIHDAIASLEKAIELNPDDPMFLFELDQMYEAAGTTPEKRLAMLTEHHAAAAKRDDTLSREIALLIYAGRYGKAIELLEGRQFHIWEGGARFGVHTAWVDAHLLRGRQRFAAAKYRDALADYQAALQYPENLETAPSRRGGRFPEIYYRIGEAYEALGDRAKARESWTASAAPPAADGERSNAIVNAGVAVYYRARSLEKLGERDSSSTLYQTLIRTGTDVVERGEAVNYFAKFGERQSHNTRMAQAHYVIGLGYMGLGEKAKAKEQFTRALELSPDHLGASTMLAAMD